MIIHDRVGHASARAHIGLVVEPLEELMARLSGLYVRHGLGLELDHLLQLGRQLAGELGERVEASIVDLVLLVQL